MSLRTLILLLTLLSSSLLRAQVPSSAEDCDKVIDKLEVDYESKPNNLFTYSKYLKCLFATRDKKKARRTIEDFASKSKYTMTQWDQMAYQVIFEKDESVLNSQAFLENQLAVSAATTRWNYLGLDELSKAALERSSKELGSSRYYADKLLETYENTEDVDKALQIYIQQLGNPNVKQQDIEEKILALVSSDENMEKARKYLLEASAANTKNTYLSKLLLWIYEAKNDWNESLNIAMDLEKKNQAKGSYANALMEDALAVDNYEVVESALDRMDKLYAGTPTGDINFLNRINYYLNYQSQKLTPSYLAEIEPRYRQLVLSGDHLDYILDYTDIHYHYLDQKDEMIALLEQLLDDRKLDSYIEPRVELRLGDYFAQDGDRWDALLYYSRVEKAHKNESIGEEARYKNAKLSYYFGDFDWAKDQLAILKTATQEYIANDALELWLRIVDNTPADSNFAPMQQLAKAEWYMWQKEYDSASFLLNTISMISTPDDPIMADVQLVSAHLAHEMGDAAAEREHLQKIIDKYPDDILADDAYYELALLDFKEGKKEDGRLLLEQFLIKFDNSPLLIDVRDLLRTVTPNS